MHLAGMHPSDEEIWRDFISSSFLSNDLLMEDELAGLIMDEGWPREAAWELASDYVRRIDQLKNFRQKAVGFDA